MPAVIPERTLEQRQHALDRANHVRFGMADVKRELHAGSLSFADALCDERAQPMEIGTLLCALPRWGRSRTRRVLTPAFIGERRRVIELTERQRVVLARLVR